MKQLLFLINLLILTSGSGIAQPITPKLDLSGTWKYALDTHDKGIKDQWFNKVFSDSLKLPGSLTTNGIGDEITLTTPWIGQIIDSSFFKKPEYAKFRTPGNIKIPFWLQPIKYYKGAAWYQKEIVIPENWNGKAIDLFLERCHWESRLWIDNMEIGMQSSLGTPHQYDLTKILTPGRHRLTICIDNRVKDFDPGVNSHSISDHTQSNWNGIVGQMYLEARPLVNIHHIQVYPDIIDKKLAVKVKVRNRTGRETRVHLSLGIIGTNRFESNTYELKAGETILEMIILTGTDLKLWSEFQPNVYTLEAGLKIESSNETDVRTTTFGMREFKTVGNQFTINGNLTFLRGTLECAIFPKTGYPPTDKEEWLRIFKVCRAHGLNHIRFHSWCPPKAAFEAADQSGLYLQVECSSWANQSTTIGDGKPFDTYLYEESQRMIDQYGNHPSFCMMTYGNEPGGDNQVSFLTKFVSFWKARDNRRIYASAAGWPNLNVNDYISDSEPRIQHWGQGLGSIINAKAPASDYDWSYFTTKFPQPVVSHEIGQWCVYPDFKEIAKYTGVLKARNFELFQETLKDNGMSHLADSFLLASGKLQALCYKADIEAALRTPKFGGFQLLDLHDFPGQGTALVGVLNPFWEEKGYITAAGYKRFCNNTVPLVRMKKFIFTNNESLEASVEVAHYGEAPVKDCVPEWKITDQKGHTIQSGKLNKTDIPLGNAFKLGDVSVPLNSVPAPEKLIFEVTVAGLSNSWDLWVYPAKKEPVRGEENVRIVQKPDEQTVQFLKNGGSVLLNLKKGTLSKEMGGDIKTGFSSIFWNTAWTSGQAPHTLGILCNPKHPALNSFPTEYHSNYQWWDAMSNSGSITYSKISPQINPIVRVIDDWVTNRPLALLFEAKVGKGKILVSGIDLTSDLDKRPEAGQLLLSLKKYMTGSSFNPTVEISESLLYKLTE